MTHRNPKGLFLFLNNHFLFLFFPVDLIHDWNLYFNISSVLRSGAIHKTFSPRHPSLMIPTGVRTATAINKQRQIALKKTKNKELNLQLHINVQFGTHIQYMQTRIWLPLILVFLFNCCICLTYLIILQIIQLVCVESLSLS